MTQHPSAEEFAYAPLELDVIVLGQFFACVQIETVGSTKLHLYEFDLMDGLFSHCKLYSHHSHPWQPSYPIQMKMEVKKTTGTNM